jgi:hypothetical protein
MADAALRRRADRAASSAAAASLIDERIAPSTKKRYAASLKVLEEYWREQIGRRFAVPVATEAIVNFFGWLVETKYKDKPPAFSTIRLYKSALLSLYKERKLMFSPEAHQRVETVLDGYKRRVAQYKLDGKMAIHEGKLPLTFDGYRLLARALFTTTPGQMLFGWPYLLLQWNLIARATSVATLMMEHISWEGDALLVTLPKHKGDQDGDHVFARHLYANTADPFICPVLALAVLVFTRVLRYDTNGSSSVGSRLNYRLFDGERSESRWSDIFKKVIEAMPVISAQQLGGSKGELGTHSIRKGAASFCAGMVSGPSFIHIFLRAGWALGGVKDRYFFPGAGGDQLTGRVLSGLSFNEAAFASLPPHFDSAGASEVVWSAVFPLYATLPDTFKRALPFLLASICHHEEWLRLTLPPHHPLFSSPLFVSGALATLKPHVLSGCQRAPETGLIATGIPPHLTMSNELTTIVRQTRDLKEQLLSQYATLPSEVVSVLLNRFTIQGAIPVTLDEIKSLLAQAVSQMNAHMREALPDAARASASASAAAADPSTGDDGYVRWMWGGVLHPVPQGFRLTSTDVMSTWRLWHFGIPAQHIGPLRRLQKVDLVGKAQHTQWSKTNGVMRAITEQLVSMALVDSAMGIGRLSEDDATAAFTRAFAALTGEFKAGARATRMKGRWMERSIATLYDHVLTWQDGRKRSREQADEAGGSESSESGRPAQQRRSRLQ